jgi:hypothetical protein
MNYNIKSTQYEGDCHHDALILGTRKKEQPPVPIDFFG